MSTLSIIIDYETNEVKWEGEINPDTAMFLLGLIKFCEDNKESMDLSRELGNIPIKADGTTRIEFGDQDQPLS